MVFKDSFESIIEAIYLEDSLSNQLGKTDIRVNPKYDPLILDYTVGKTIILTNSDIDIRVIDKLRSSNHIISRVNSYEGVEFQPYITRINFNVMWNGDTLDCEGCTSRELSESINNLDEFDSSVLYFPKVINIDRSSLFDQDGNINAIGWLLHQVGQNFDMFTPFRDLDLLKTKKLSLNNAFEKALNSYK